MSEKYKFVSITQFTSFTDDCVMTIGKSGFYNNSLLVRDTSCTTSDEIKTAVSTSKTIYPLATPTEFAVTTPSIPTPKGNAYTWATAEDGVVDSMEATYIKSE